MTDSSILIVEDEDIIATDIQESLEESGYRVAGRAANATSAVSLSGELSPDLILMDIKLQGDEDGIEAATKIKSRQQVPIIFLTAFADEETLSRAKVTEPYGYVLKPFKQAELRTAIELALYRAKQDRQTANGLGVASSSFAEAVELSEEGREIADNLAAIEPFSKLSEEELSNLASSCRFEFYKSGELISFAGDDLDAGFVVADGRVSMVKSSVNGKDLIVELLPPGDPFGLFPILDKRPMATNLRAQIDSKVIWVPRNRFLAVLDAHPELSKSIIEEMFARLRSAHSLSRALAHDRVEVRVANALLAVAPKFTKDAAVQDDTPKVKMTRQELSELVGSTTETVIRVCRAFEKENVLDLSENGYVRLANLEALSEVAEGF